MANVPYSGVPTAEPSSGGSGATYASVPEATSAAFGGQIGQAEEKFGATSTDLGKMYQLRANEASANDKIVNQWAPTVTQLSQDYYSKQGKDAVAGFQPYIDGLQKSRADLLQNATPAEAQILNQYMTRHIAQEYDGAMRHQVQQMDVYENQMSDAFVNLQSTNAVNAGSNPDMIDAAIKSGMARLQVHGIDRGESPEAIQQKQNEFEGRTAQAVVSSAVSRGDLSFANDFYANHKENIPGPQQIDIDRSLHAENMKVFGNSAATAIINGAAIPHSIAGGAEVTNVKATVAGTAQSAGVDPNSSLMIAGIESSFGQNVGARGDIGQTGKPAKDINEQAQNLIAAQKQAQEAANKAVGGTAAPWQMYTVYQQGVGGGVALLKPENANAKAVDVIAPFYPNPKDAKDAIVKNGGNVTMTSAQFTDMLKQKCDTIYGQVKCDTSTPAGQPIDLGKAIVDPHQTGGITVQPAATPVRALQEFDSQYPQMLQRAQEIPNIDQRNATLDALEQKHRVYQAGANAYTSVLIKQAGQLAADPKFTSMDQVPPELNAALATDHPQTLAYLETRANYNLEHSSGLVTKDMKEYGAGMNNTLKGIWNGSITSVSQLHEAVANGNLTIAGYDRAEKELAGKNTPDGESEGKMREQTFKVVRRMVSGQDDALSITDKKGEEIYAHAMPLIYKAIEDGKSKNIPASELYDPDSKNWVGNVAKGLKRSLAQQTADMMNDAAGGESRSGRSLNDIIREAQATNDPAKKEALKAEAISLGFIRPDTRPQVPLAQ